MTAHKLNPNTKAFCFDVFGTCVDWRKSVTNELHHACQKAIADPASRPDSVTSKASVMTEADWGDIAQEWRTTYYKFTRELASNPSATFKTVDEHHHSALLDILAAHGLTGLWTAPEIEHLALVWHRLDSWPDTNAGLDMLAKHGYETATLSNGNVSLLTDMQKHSGMRFTHTYSAELFGAYKPNPKTYLGAVEKLGLQPGQVAMVAAHLGDLKAAKTNGLGTVFVEREREEEGDLEAARREGYVDLWIGLGEDGFLGVAKALGLS